MFNYKTKDDKLDITKLVIHSVLAVILLILTTTLFPLGTIGAGQRGVLLQFGAVQDKVFGEGLYFRIPIVQNVEKMDIKIHLSLISLFNDNIAFNNIKSDRQPIANKK